MGIVTSSVSIYQDVQIFKSQPLGEGTHCVVYRAKCDQLQCAAKLLHPNAGPHLSAEFVQQCESSCLLKHPNFVQCLGVSEDPESGSQALLMELMDETLTNFLERSQEPLPYSIQVDLCHDIAMILVHIHSCEEMHYVISNDILLKHGMTKLGAGHIFPPDMSPEFLVYMPLDAVSHTGEDEKDKKAIAPAGDGYTICELCDESLADPVTYHMKDFHPGCGKHASWWGYNSRGTFCSGWAGNCGDGGQGDEMWYLMCSDCHTKYLTCKDFLANYRRQKDKIDVFSFGVLGVQILTRKFPDPSGPMSSSTTVPEVERRKSHIDLIDPSHPLLPLFLDCLKDHFMDRPTAKEICDRLEALKETPQYISSAQHQQQRSDWQYSETHLSEITAAKQEAETALLQKEQQCQLRERECDRLVQKLEANARETRRVQQQLEEKDAVIRRTRQQLGEKDAMIRRTRQQLGEKDQMIQRLQLQLQQSQSQHTEFWKVPREEVTLDMQKFLGSGAWGFVTEGKFRGQRVAVKCLHNAIHHPTFIRTIRDEINIMAQIRHPNMVLLIAAVVGGDAEPPLIIMELLDMSVRRAYERNLLQDSSKLSIFRDIACALNYLHLHHRGPFIHRDVNSANVLLEAKPNNQWKARVSDFGSAKLIRDAKTTAPGATVYAAPEVRNEIGIRQTNKVDVYSYGVLLGEIILEEFPVDGLTPIMMEAIRSKWLLMHGLITDCTKDHPDNRPTMSDILDTITPRPRPQ